MLLIHQNFMFCILLRNVILTENKKNMMNNYSIIGVCFLAQLAVKKLLHIGQQGTYLQFNQSYYQQLTEERPEAI